MVLDEKPKVATLRRCVVAHAVSNSSLTLNEAKRAPINQYLNSELNNMLTLTSAHPLTSAALWPSKQCIAALLASLSMLTPVGAAAHSVIVPLPSCEQYPARNLKQLETELLAGLTASDRNTCDVSRLSSFGAAAVPTIIRLLDQRDSYSAGVALSTIRDLGPLAAGAMPSLLAMLKETYPIPARSEPQFSSDGRLRVIPFDYISVFMAIRALGPASAPAKPYLLELMRHPHVREGGAVEAFSTYWELTDGSVVDRVRAANVLLPEQETPQRIIDTVANYMSEKKPADAELISALLARLQVRPSESVARAYLVLQGNEVGVPALLHLLSHGNKDNDAIRYALAGKLTAAELDALFSRSANETALAPAIVSTLNLLNMEAPLTIAALVAKMRTPDFALEAVRTLAELRRKVPIAQSDLLAGLRTNNPGDPDVRPRNTYLNAILAIGDPNAIPGSFLIEGVKLDLLNSARHHDVGCVPLTVLAEVQLPPARALPLAIQGFQLYRFNPDNFGCFRMATRLIGRLNTRPAAQFLYRQLLADSDNDRLREILEGLATHPDLIWPDVEMHLGMLNAGQITMLESILRDPRMSTLLASHRDRILPGLKQTLRSPDVDRPWRKQADEFHEFPALGRPWPDQPFPASVGGVAARRVARFLPITPELLPLLVDVVAGPSHEAGAEAMQVLTSYGGNESRNWKGLREQIEAKLKRMSAPPGIGRLFELLSEYDRFKRECMDMRKNEQYCSGEVGAEEK